MHTAVWVPEDARAFATCLARYCARNSVALERLPPDHAATAEKNRSDRSEGQTAGRETVDPLEFLARVLAQTSVIAVSLTDLRARAAQAAHAAGRSPPSIAVHRCRGAGRCWPSTSPQSHAAHATARSRSRRSSG